MWLEVLFEAGVEAISWLIERVFGPIGCLVVIAGLVLVAALLFWGIS